MLVLSRVINEKVIITVPPSDKPRTITVTQIDIRGNKSRLGFAADQDVEIHREEVQDAIQRHGSGHRPINRDGRR